MKLNRVGLSVFFILVIFMCNESFAQIPYRQQNQWGLIKPNGKFLIKPAYDRILFGNEAIRALPDGFYGVMKGKKKGIVSNKEIIPPVYDEIYCYDREIIVCIDRSKDKHAHFDINGKPLLPENIYPESFQWRPYTLNGHSIYIFGVKLEDGTEGVYQLDSRNPRNSKLLFSGLMNVQYKRFDENNVIMFRKYSSSRDFEDEYYRYDSAKFSIVPLYGKPKDLYEEEVGEYSKGFSDDVAMVPHEADPDQQKPDAFNNRFQQAEFMYKKDTLRLLWYENGKRIEQIHSLPEGYTYKRISNYYGNATKAIIFPDGSTKTLRNFVFVKNNNRQGFYLEPGAAPLMFDSIQTVYPFRSNTLYVVGNKGKDGMLRFGLYDLFEGFKIPMEYESLQSRLYNSKQSTENTYITARKNDLYGVMSLNNQIIIPLEYDSVINLQNHVPGIMYVLKKDDKYGYYYLSEKASDNAPIYRKPFSKYRVGYRYVIKVNKTATFFFVHLDEHKNPVGLSDLNGKMYWKD